jgi:hypothetical protein
MQQKISQIRTTETEEKQELKDSRALGNKRNK